MPELIDLRYVSFGEFSVSKLKTVKFLNSNLKGHKALLDLVCDDVHNFSNFVKIC